MATEVDWNTVGGKSGGAGKGKMRFIRFEDGSSIEVRPVGKAVEFYKFFIQETQRSVVVDLNDGTKAAEILTEHTGKEVKPSHRYSMNVIDRSDGMVRILEGGRSIFKYFGAWAKRTKSHPGGQNGGNWLIEAAGKGLNREYTTTFVGPAPISDQERSSIKANGDLYTLEDVFKTTPLDELLEKCYGTSPANEPAPSTPPQQAVAEEAAVGDIGGDDPINW